MNKLLMLFTVLVMATLLFPNVLAITQEECENGGGEWTTPQIASPDEPDSAKKKLKPYCKCDTGFYWDTISSICKDDSKIRCIQTQGEWIDDECQCPEGTIKWTPVFGCDKEGPIPLESSSKMDSENIGGYNKMIGITVIIAGGLVFIWFMLKKGGKKKNEYL